MHSPGGDTHTGAPLTIGAVSELIGVPTPTIRSWERRYQLPTGPRSTSGQRRYGPADVEVLTRMRDETAAGRGAAATAALVCDAAALPVARAVDLLLAAALRLDSRSLEQTLRRRGQTHGLVVTLERVALPALRLVGDRWAAGLCDVAHEHLLTGALQTWLSRQQPSTPPSRPGPVVLACAPAERHTLALRALSVILADRGFDCLFLGARVPARSLALAVQQASAGAVVVVAQLGRSRPGAVAALRAAAEAGVAAAPSSPRLYHAGAALAEPRHRRGVPGTHLGDSLAGAAEQITADADRVGSAPARPAGLPRPR